MLASPLGLAPVAVSVRALPFSVTLYVSAISAVYSDDFPVIAINFAPVFRIAHGIGVALQSVLAE